MKSPAEIREEVVNNYVEAFWPVILKNFDGEESVISCKQQFCLLRNARQHVGKLGFSKVFDEVRDQFKEKGWTMEEEEGGFLVFTANEKP